MPAPPKDFALLIGKRLAKKGGGEDGPPPGMPDDGGEAEGDQSEQMKRSAMSDFISAVHAKSPGMASSALEDFIEMCQGDQAEEPEEGPPPPPEE